MTLKSFWEKLDKYCEENHVSYYGICKDRGLSPTYLKCLKSRFTSFPSPLKLMKLKGILTDDEMFEILREREKLSGEADDFLMSLKVSKEVRMKNRIKRQIQRGVSL
ncbi:hypothetical protein AAFF39_00210 [Lactococcus garvieae]